MEFLSSYGLFLLKAITIVIAILAVVGGILSLSMRQRGQNDEKLEVKNLNDKFTYMGEALEGALMDPIAMKAHIKAEKKKAKEEAKVAKKKAKAEAKADAKAAKKNKKADKANSDSDKKDSDDGNESDSENTDDTDPDKKKRLFVIDFDGDVQATPVDQMREEISAVMAIAEKSDEVLIRVESGGGAVHAYGLAASQLQRIRDKGIPLTVSVDKVAASGGYLMACVADKIIAAPFSIIGSIGVVAQIPNFNKILKKNDIDLELVTAGKHKRTLTLFGENTDEGRKKMKEELEEVHVQFKQFVSERRPDMDIEKVATGEHWLGAKALELGLVDELQTSDDYLMSQRDDADIVEIHFTGKQSFMEKLSSKVSLLLSLRHKATSESNYPHLM